MAPKPIEKIHISLAIPIKLKMKFQRTTRRNLTNMNAQIRKMMEEYVFEYKTTKPRKTA